MENLQKARPGAGQQSNLRSQSIPLIPSGQPQPGPGADPLTADLAPTEESPRDAWAAYYRSLGLALCHIQPGTKAPQMTGWPTGNLDPEHWKTHPQDGLGAVLAPSRLVSLDLDALPETRALFAELGLDWERVTARAWRLRGNPARMRILYRAPESPLSLHKLVWPPRAAGGKPVTVFELRAGPVQDVLPPTIHPDTQAPYEWLVAPWELAGELAEPPVELLELWQNWQAWEPALKAMCPWAKQPEPQAKPGQTGELSVISAWNQAHDVGQILVNHGYRPKGRNRWVAPTSESCLPGVVLLDSGKIYSHHGADPLADGHAHDAFSAWTILAHGGDQRAPVREAGRMLGMEAALPKPGAAPESGGDSADTPTVPVPVWPVLSPQALTGLAGDVVRLATANSEADPAAVLLTFLTAFGAACGRSSMVLVGDTEHHPRLFTALVGASSRARKGTSGAPIKRLIRSAEQALSPPAAQLSPLFPLKISDGPLSSGEGLIWAIRDESEDLDKNGEPVTAGVEDKRLLVIEGEFGGALRVAGREGSSLSAILRTGWDGSQIRPLVTGRSKAVVGASDPHLCIVGHVTEAELKAVLSDVDVFNGLANRFLWTCVRRGTLNPFPAPMPEHLVKDLAARIAGALMFAEREQCLELSDEAREAWAKSYRTLTQDEPGAFGATIARAEAQTLRLALVFALLDCSGTIGQVHLLRAVAVWQYCRDSAAYLFGALSTDKMVERVAKIITEAGAQGISQADLSKALNRHVKGDRLAAILAELQSAGRVTQTRVDTPGRPAVIWRARHG